MIESHNSLVPLLAGGVSGICVDVAMYPLDTLKTRMQSPQGFWKAGGFKNVYRGLGTAALGAAPGAALFFMAYETCKTRIQHISGLSLYASALVASCAGEVAACMVRVPTDNIKQKQQAGIATSYRETARLIVSAQGMRGFYSGWSNTLSRDLPFAAIQLPLYELFKTMAAKQLYADGDKVSCNGAVVSPPVGAVCGAVASAISGVFTTPLDVLKTRRMVDVRPLAEQPSAFVRAQELVRGEGYTALWRGGVSRATMLFSGGIVLFGAYTTFTATFAKAM